MSNDEEYLMKEKTKK